MLGHLDDVEHPLQVPEARGVAGGEAQAVPLGRGSDQQVEPPRPGVATCGPGQVRQQAVGLHRRDVERDDVERVDDELLPPPTPLPLDRVGRSADPYSSSATVIALTATKSAINRPRPAAGA